MGTFSRLRYVIAANVNALIEKAEDPEKLLKALIREMEDASEEARMASAELLAEQSHLDRLNTQLSGETEQWHQRAQKAVSEQRDDLARSALKARAEVADRNVAVEQELGIINERIRQMEADMTTLKSKMASAKLKLKGLQIQASPGNASRSDSKPALSPAEKRVQRAFGRFDRLQTQVESLEARVRSYEVGASAPAVWESELAAADPAVEEELLQMKQRLTEESNQDDTEAAA
jgi:phage shock protein A